jgi:hypothetical protein
LVAASFHGKRRVYYVKPNGLDPLVRWLTQFTGQT